MKEVNPTPFFRVFSDEPTNHLDLDAARQFEHALAAYAGAMVVVSHDEAFLETIAPIRRLEPTASEIRHRGRA